MCCRMMLNSRENPHTVAVTSDSHVQIISRHNNTNTYWLWSHFTSSSLTSEKYVMEYWPPFDLMMVQVFLSATGGVFVWTLAKEVESTNQRNILSLFWTYTLNKWFMKYNCKLFLRTTDCGFTYDAW